MRCTPGEFQRPRRLSILDALTAGLFVAYLISLPPHLVHHLFDEEQGRPDCPLLALSHQSSKLQSADPPSLNLPAPTDVLCVPCPRAVPPAPDLPATQSRAPPRA